MSKRNTDYYNHNISLIFSRTLIRSSLVQLTLVFPTRVHGKKEGITDEKEKMSHLKVQLLIISILVLDLIAFTSILPLLPSILLYYEKETANDSSHTFIHKWFQVLNSVRVYLGIPNIERYNAVLIGGSLGSMFSFLQFICNPIFGSISDVAGRKKILLMTMFGTGISYFVWIKSTSFEWFFLSRFIGGISKCSVTISTAMISDITDENQRGKGMALIGVSFAIAFIVGPICGAYFAANIANMSDNYPFMSPAVFSLCLQSLAIILAIFLLPETKIVATEVTFTQSIKSAVTLINPMRLFTPCKGRSSHKISPGCGQILLINFMFLLLFSGLEFTLTFLTHQRFGFGNRQQGFLFLYVGIIMVMIQSGFMRRLKIGKEQQMAASGIFVMIPSMVIMAFANNTQMLYVGLVFFSYSAAIVIPCLTTLYSQKINKAESGEMLGIFRSVGALSRALGPFIICFLYWIFGSIFCYLISACMFCVPLVLCYHLDNTNVKKE